MNSNIAILPPSTNSLHWFSLLDTSLSNPISSYELIPTLNKPVLSTQRRVDIPPLLAESSLEKRLNLSDLSNPIQKRIRHNPEASIYSTQIPVLGSQSLVEDLFTYNNFMSGDYNALIANLDNSRNPKRQRRSEPERYRHEENQFVNMKKLSNKERHLPQRQLFAEEIRDCDLSDWVAPQIPNLIAPKKLVNNDYEELQRLQQALQTLQNKIFNVEQQEAQRQTPQFYNDNLLPETTQELFSAKLAGYSQVEIGNLKRNKAPAVKIEKIGWNESPNSTGVETNNSCSTSELCESDCGVSPGFPKYDDISVHKAGKTQKKVESATIQNQVKNSTEKPKTMIEVIDKSIKTSTENKIQIQVKEEASESKRAKENRSRTKLDPNFVSKWDVKCERRRNRWQQSSLSQSNGLLSQDLKLMNLLEDDLIETPIGPNYQAEITSLDRGSQQNKGKRCPKLKWDPSNVKQSRLDSYFKKIEEMLRCNINQEKAINLLINNENDPKKVYKQIEGREKEYIRDFLIRPKRIPEAPIFGDFRVLY